MTKKPDDKGEQLPCKVVTDPVHHAYYKRKVVFAIAPAKAASGKTVTRSVHLTCEQGHKAVYEVQVPEEG